MVTGGDLYGFIQKIIRDLTVSFPLGIRGDRLVIGSVILATLFIALFAVLWSRESKISIDNRKWSAAGISGRPDAVTRRFSHVIPHEYKSRASRKGEPFDNHVVQLKTYCYILNKVGYRVSRGMLHYSDTTFEIPWGRRERADFEVFVEKARNCLEGSAIPVRLEGWDPRCSRCQYRYSCWPAKKTRDGDKNGEKPSYPGTPLRSEKKR